MFQIYHENDWSGDSLYRDWEQLEAADINTEHSVGEDLTKDESSIVSVDIHNLQAAVEYELFQEWVAENNHVLISCQFHDHLVRLRRENYYPYPPLHFHDDNDEDHGSVHH